MFDAYICWTVNTYFLHVKYFYKFESLHTVEQTKYNLIMLIISMLISVLKIKQFDKRRMRVTNTLFIYVRK